MLSTHLLLRQSSYRNFLSVPELVLKISELKGNQQKKDEGHSRPQIRITILDSSPKDILYIILSPPLAEPVILSLS